MSGMIRDNEGVVLKDATPPREAAPFRCRILGFHKWSAWDEIDRPVVTSGLFSRGERKQYIAPYQQRTCVLCEYIDEREI